MIDPISTAISGMNNATKTVSKAADNIADPAKQDRTVEDIVDIKTAEVTFKANAAVIRTASDMSDTLLESFDKDV